MDSGEGTSERRNGSFNGASIGNVLLLLHEAKKEITSEIRSRSEELNKDLGEKLDAMSNQVVQKVMSGISSRSLGRTGSTKSRISDEKKRKALEPLENLTFLDVVLENDKTPFVLQWTMLVTLYAFGRAHSPAMQWLSNAAKEQIAPHTELLNNVSGLSVLFFSVEAYHKWSRYHGKIGKLWSFVLRNSISSSILSTRALEFDTQSTPDDQKRGRTVPPWLDSFGGKKQTAAAVSEIIQCLETTEEIARASGDADIARRRKRMRLRCEPPADDYEGERDYAVREVRSAMLRTWSYGRAEARRVLLSSVMFLVEKIRSYPTICDASDEGYEIIFHPPSSAEETYVPYDISGTVWEIPPAFIRDGSDNELRDKNNDLLQQLALRFPSLRLTLKYKRSIVRANQAAETEEVPEYWDADEDISLHQLAATVLTASLSAKNIKTVLRTSRHSLRAIHILAIGLRGLIRPSLKLELSSLEKSALGGVTCEEISKDDGDKVSTISGTKGGARQGRNGVTSMQSVRDTKLTMSYAAYCSEEEKRRMMRMEEESCARSEAGQVDHDAEGETDLIETWLEGTE